MQAGMTAGRKQKSHQERVPLMADNIVKAASLAGVVVYA